MIARNKSSLVRLVETRGETVGTHSISTEGLTSNIFRHLQTKHGPKSAVSKQVPTQNFCTSEKKKRDFGTVQQE